MVNGHHTERAIGSPITDAGLKILKLFQPTYEANSKSYFTQNIDGKLLKSSRCILFGVKGNSTGMPCIPLNFSVPFPEIIQTFVLKLSNALFDN
ncbi:PAS domain-containing protein [Acinetobacter guillouiae]|uniref:PAS domain-containing protein n=1 Tax=Acinetobacter guillouiae TaxID=106649 RepID=UPI001C06C4C3